MGVEAPILSVCSGMLEPLPLEHALSAVREAELDAIELLGEPRSFDEGELRSALERNGIEVTGLTAAARRATGRDLAHPDAAVRARTLEHLRSCIDLAARLGAPVVGVAPSAVGRHWLEASEAAEWGWAVEGLARLADLAEDRGVTLGLEVLNRYATPTVTTVDAALAMIDDVGGGPLGVVVDLFHAAIEEASVPGAIRAAGARLVNLQVADSTREGPGHGSFDFLPTVEALVDIGYAGPLALEAFPLGSGAFPTVTTERLPASLAYVKELRPFFSALPIALRPAGGAGDQRK